MAAPFYCPNCSAKLRGMHVLERHLSQKIACRHNAHLTRRRRRSASPIARHPILAQGTTRGHTEVTHTTLPSQQDSPAGSIQGDQSRLSTEAPITDTAGRTYLFPQAGKAMWRQPTLYEAHKNARDAAGLPDHAPFASVGEWELTQILIESGISQRSTDRILKSDMVSPLASTVAT